MRPLLSTASSFAAPTVDKVERLLEVLAALRDDPLLGSAFVLHGGTALNVFSDELPRLSIDVDLMYVGQLDMPAMRTERPRVDARLREVAGKLGYAVRGTSPISREWLSWSRWSGRVRSARRWCRSLCSIVESWWRAR
jgi:hypothetical protein